MTRSYKIILGLVLVAVFAVSALPADAATSPRQSGFSIIPCGGPGQNTCTFDDIIIMLTRLINYLFAVAGIVAVYHIMLAGWNMMSAMGAPEKLTTAKQGLAHAVIGFALILLAFAIINLLLGLFGITCEWWKPDQLTCLYG